MTLMDARPPKVKRGLFKYIPLPLFIIICAAIAGFVIHHFWNYPERHAVARFLTTLEQGNYQKAYKLWQPAPTYHFSDFMHDWGPEGDYGKIRSFDVLDAKSRGSSTVLVYVTINGRVPPLGLLVNRHTKGLAYKPEGVFCWNISGRPGNPHPRNAFSNPVA